MLQFVGLHGSSSPKPDPNVFWAFLSSSTALRESTPEWSSCEDDLDRTRRASSDASDAAKDVSSKRDDFEQCQRDRQTFDFMADGCKSRRSDYQSAISDYESKMDDLDSRLRDVQSSCGYDFTINRMSSLEASNHRLNAARQRLCKSFKDFVPIVGTDGALKLCSAQMSQEQEWCKSCLGIP
jgi:hypothetical protein